MERGRGEVPPPLGARGYEVYEAKFSTSTRPEARGLGGFGFFECFGIFLNSILLYLGSNLLAKLFLSTVDQHNVQGHSSSCQTVL